MSDKRRGSDGRLSKTIHLYMILVLLLAAGCASASAQTLSFDQQNMTNNVTIISTPTPLATGIPASSDLSGFIVDSKGNKVPGAFVMLYRDNNTAPIAGNPMYSIGDPSGYGGFHFTGLRPGNYTIKAEKADIYMYSGNASLTIQTDTDAQMDVTLKGYVFKPFVTPTPVPPQPTAEPAIVPTAAPTAVPGNDDLISKVNDKALGPVIIAFGVAIVGAGALTIKDWLWPKKKTAAAAKAPCGDAKPVVGVPKKEERSNGSTPVINKTPEYMQDIEELARMNAATGYGDIAVLNRVNAISKKYSVDQNTVFMDMKKIKTKKP